MKYLQILLFLVFCFSDIAQAKLWRVNNNTDFIGGETTPCDHCFSSLQNAINSSDVLPGDTLYVEASAQSYGNITLNKPLTIVGTGYLLKENTEIQYSTLSSQLGRLTLKTGADGSVLSGLILDDNYVGVTLELKQNEYFKELTITRSLIRAIHFYANDELYDFKNISITKCMILNDVVLNDYDDVKISNLELRNNIIGGDVEVGKYCTGSISQNVIEGGVEFSAGIDFFNNIVTSNSTSLAENDNSSSNIYNNMFLIQRPTWLSGGDNQFGVNMATVFPAAGNTEDRYKPFASCSKCQKGYKASGANNKEIGIYGGIDPYVKAGVPAIPTIYDFKLKTTSFPRDTIDVQISTKTHK